MPIGERQQKYDNYLFLLQVDMYKKEIKRNQEEKKLLLCCRHSEPLPCPVPQPQLEIVYPFVNYDRQQQLQWRQEQQRRVSIDYFVHMVFEKQGILA